MHQQPDIYAGLNDTALSEYFRNAGDRLIDESAVMSLAISSILESEGHLSLSEWLYYYRSRGYTLNPGAVSLFLKLCPCCQMNNQDGAGFPKR